MISCSSDLSSPLGLLAGNGDFTIEFARRARSINLELITVGYQNETPSELREFSREFQLVKIGQLAKAIKIFKRAGVRQLCILGGIRRFRLFGGVRLDWRALRAIARAGSMHDDALLSSLTTEFELCGFEVIPASILLNDFLARKGQLTDRALTSDQIRDAIVGWRAARKLGELDIGQTVVVHKSLVVAVEASEGTDQTIIRAGELNARGGVVVKLAKPQQDRRVDLPSVGPQTIMTMKTAGMKALVLEHEGAHILRPDEFSLLAKREGIAVEVIEDSKELEDRLSG